MPRSLRVVVLVAAVVAAAMFVVVPPARGVASRKATTQRYLNGVSCRPVRSCVAVGGAQTSTTSRSGALLSGSAGLIAYRSTNGGARWSPVRLPASRDANFAAVACTSASHCVAVGYHKAIIDHSWFQTTAVTMVTVNGRTWRTAALPQGSPALSSVACPTAARCVAVGGRLIYGKGVIKTTALVSADGGVKWSVARLPSMSGDLEGVSCPTPTHCLATGATSYISRHGNSASKAIAVSSTDGGIKWKLASISGAGGPVSVSCSSAKTCVAFGDTFNWCFCGTGVPGHYGEVWATNNGGSTWTKHVLPTVGGYDVWYADSVTCTSASSCLLSAEGTTPKSGSATWPLMLTVSASAGWRPSRQSPPRKAAPGWMWSYGLTCANSSHCVAVGESHSAVSAATGRPSRWRVARF